VYATGPLLLDATRTQVVALVQVRPRSGGDEAKLSPLGPLKLVQDVPLLADASPIIAPPAVSGGPASMQLVASPHATACNVAVEAGRLADAFVHVEPPSGETPRSPGLAGIVDGPISRQVAPPSVHAADRYPLVPPLTALVDQVFPPSVLSEGPVPAATHAVA
jgi:hypothetical protein